MTYKNEDMKMIIEVFAPKYVETQSIENQMIQIQSDGV